MPSDKFKLDSATIAEGPSVVDMKEVSMSTGKNFKIVIGVSIAVILAVGGYFAWKHFKKKQS